MFSLSDVLGLLIGLVVVMIVVALTLPDTKEVTVSDSCLQACKMLIKEQDRDSMLSAFSHVREMTECIEYCIEEINENSD